MPAIVQLGQLIIPVVLLLWCRQAIRATATGSVLQHWTHHAALIL